MINLLVIIAIILLILWLLGITLHFLAGPILWVLLVIGIVLAIVWLWRRVKH
jgi:hypothetical protein